METIITVCKKRKAKLVVEPGIVSKEAVRELDLVGMLGKMVDSQGRFKDSKIQAAFEKWLATPEGAKYA